MSGSTPAAFNHAEIIMEGGIHARCLALAGFVWLVYDYFLTLEQEVSFLSPYRAYERPAEQDAD